MDSGVAIALGASIIHLPDVILSQTKMARSFYDRLGREQIMTIDRNIASESIDAIVKANKDIVTTGNLNLEGYTIDIIQDILSFYNFIGYTYGCLLVTEQRIHLGDFSNLLELYELMKQGSDPKWKTPSERELKTMILNGIFKFTDYDGIAICLSNESLRDDRSLVFLTLIQNYFAKHESLEDRCTFINMLSCHDLFECKWADEVLLVNMNMSAFKNQMLRKYPFLSGIDWSNICLPNIEEALSNKITLYTYGTSSPEIVLKDTLAYLVKFGFTSYKLQGNIVTTSDTKKDVDIVVDLKNSLCDVISMMNVRDQTVYNGINVLATYPCKQAIEKGARKESHDVTIITDGYESSDIDDIVKHINVDAMLKPRLGVVSECDKERMTVLTTSGIIHVPQQDKITIGDIVEIHNDKLINHSLYCD